MPLKTSKTKQTLSKRKVLSQAVLTRQALNKITGGHTRRVAPYWWEKEIKGAKEIRVCSECQAVYFKKHWWNIPGFLKQVKKEQIISDICPECQWIKSGKHDLKTGYEGEVIITHNLEEKRKEELLNLIRNIGNRANARDPEDKIIKIEDLKNKILVKTTENQLAISIGKQVAQAFKKSQLEIKFSHQDALARVYLQIL